MTINEIRTKRRLLGLTTEDLAKRVGVTKQTISNIENGKTPLTKVMDKVIAYELGKAFIEWGDWS